MALRRLTGPSMRQRGDTASSSDVVCFLFGRTPEEGWLGNTSTIVMERFEWNGTKPGRQTQKKP